MDGSPLAAARSDYDGDFFAWAMQQAALLRAGRLSEADLENIAEELESLAKRVRRQIVSRLEILLAHLLKWEVQTDLRTPSWRSTILTQRAHLAGLLAENPSLDARWDDLVASAYDRAVRLASIESGIPRSRFRLVPLWSRDQVLSEDFLPETVD